MQEGISKGANNGAERITSHCGTKNICFFKIEEDTQKTDCGNVLRGTAFSVLPALFSQFVTMSGFRFTLKVFVQRVMSLSS